MSSEPRRLRTLSTQTGKFGADVSQQNNLPGNAIRSNLLRSRPFLSVQFVISPFFRLNHRTFKHQNGALRRLQRVEVTGPVNHHDRRYVPPRPRPTAPSPHDLTGPPLHQMRRLARPPNPDKASADYAKARASLIKVTDDSAKQYLASISRDEMEAEAAEVRLGEVVVLGRRGACGRCMFGFCWRGGSHSGGNCASNLQANRRRELLLRLRRLGAKKV